MSRDLVCAVLDACRTHAGAPALTGPDGTTLRYAALGARVRAVAGRLRAAGFAPGERMLFSVRPSPDAVVLALGAVAAGGTVVFVDPGAGPELFAARTELAAATWAAAESLLYASGRPPLRALARRRGVLLPDYGALPVRHVRAGRWLPGVPRGALALAGLLRPGPPVVVRPAPEQDAVVVFTSGTTAAPKAVVHTRGSLGAALDVLATRCALGPGSHVHTDQLLLGLPALVGGGHWSLPPHGFAPGARPEELATGLAGATHTFLVPADLAAVLDAVEGGRAALPSGLRQVLLGAAPVLPPLLRRAVALLPDVEFLAVYGMTEILPVAIATAAEKLAFDDAAGQAGERPGPGGVAWVRAEPGGGAAGERGASRAEPGARAGWSRGQGGGAKGSQALSRGSQAVPGGSPEAGGAVAGDLLGAPLPGVVVRVAADGELLVSGPNLARGYLGEPPLREHATGDLGRLVDGRIVLTGRTKDMIIRNHTNIYPGLYEPLVAREPGVAQAVLVGVPDAIGDERVVLAVVAAPGVPPGLAERLRARLPRILDAAALPDDIVLLDALPVAGRSRKVDRAALRELLR